MSPASLYLSYSDLVAWWLYPDTVTLKVSTFAAVSWLVNRVFRKQLICGIMAVNNGKESDNYTVIRKIRLLLI
jgi:hypothetical protein